MNDGQMAITVNGKVELPYCADSGSDWNEISRKHVQPLQGQGPMVKPAKIDNAVESRAVGGSLLTSTHAVDIYEDEVHVGKALLSELGIDIEHKLDYLASRDSDEDDPFEEPDGMPPCRPSVGDVVLNAVDALVQDTIDCGVVDDYIASRPFEVPKQVSLLEKINKRLVELGYAYENRESRWCCPILPVRKPKTDEFRQTTDYRPLNAVTEAIAGVMPSLEVAFERCKLKMFYAMFDFLKGFWQLPMTKCSQEFLSYMTDKGISRLPGYLKGALMLPYTFNLLWKRCLVTL
ncbi:Glycoside hydrolase [Phytophthora palmivora]|uniref:Glycoside hydrolase n=1 Tax=Phytophthora palmivora TaxID=4796 RepID=A0A2P4WYP1_9STRA|nr:Glycoside hydrolase [Phytophthora palmivora]